MKIIVTDKVAEDGIEYLRKQGFEVDAKFGIPQNELLEIIENYDAIIVRSATKLNAELLARAKNLKVAGRAGNGIDNIDVAECTKRGIVVVNTPEGNIMAAAELTTSYGWTPKSLTAFETMRNTALSYQAPVKVDIEATWCDESKQKVYGRLTAQDKGVPELLYPYQTTSVTFTKDDVLLSRNFQYLGLEWDYTPESDEYSWQSVQH